VHSEPRERVWWLLNVVFPAGRANGAPSKPLAGFEKPLRGGRKKGKREGLVGKIKERKGWKGRKTPPPQKQIVDYDLN